MTAPQVKRTDPPLVADERTMLTGWLDYHRATLVMKCAGLSDQQLKLRSAEPSTLSLLGLVRHLTDVERSWFRRRVAGEQGPDVGPIYYSEERVDGDFDDLDDTDPARVFAAYAEEVERCRAAVDGLPLDHSFLHDGWTFSLRWVYLHMIVEYARHNGHADLLRERIDGVTGE